MTDWGGWVQGIVSSLITLLLGGTFFWSQLEKRQAKKEKEREEKEEAKRNENLELQATDRYAAAVEYLKPEVQCLKEQGLFTPEQEHITRDNAIALADSVMPRELAEWVNSYFANPEAWKRTKVDNLVQALRRKES
jgi:Na+-transporting methylmalonyl-CoA/oxaloacetate decarboxylase gamma subunit